MKGKNQKNKRKSELNAMFFIILLALVMFIISTYAWFSTQKNVSITNLSGTVEVAEGLEISLDAENWSNGIVLGTDKDNGQLSIMDDAYPGHHNLSPTEMLPVSTLGLIAGDMTDLNMLRGKITNSKQLSEIVTVDEKITEPTNKLYPGYFAFDIFLKNSSKSTENDDILQLNFDSSLEILEAAKSATGLQNTARIAFAKYEGTSDVMADQATILNETAGIGSSSEKVYIDNVAIWEPNSSNHVEYIVRNNNKITWADGDKSKYVVYDIDGDEIPDGFGPDTKMPTYGLKASAINSSTVIDDIYMWNNNGSIPLQKQNVLQTTKSKDDYTIEEGVQNLVNADDGTTPFTIKADAISRIRIYMWLEGQDVDCINYASHGGGIKTNIGLVKGSVVGSKGEPAE